MRASGRRLLLALLVVLVPGLVLAQSLGDAAARERQKRQAAGTRQKAKLLTNDDLQGKDQGSASTAAQAPSSEAPARGRGEDEQSQGAAGASPVEQAQARADTARAAVVEAEARVKELGDKLNPMSGSFIYGATGSNSASEEAQVRAQLGEAQAQLETARAELVQANQALEDARRRSAATPK